MTYAEMEEALRNARPANFAAKALPSSVGVSAHAALIKAVMDDVTPVIRGVVDKLVEHKRQIAELKAEIAQLKTLATASRPPAARRRWDPHDAGDPNSFDWRQ